MPVLSGSRSARHVHQAGHRLNYSVERRPARIGGIGAETLIAQ